MFKGRTYCRRKTWFHIFSSFRQVSAPIAIIVIFPGCLSHRIENPEKYKVEGIQYGITKGNFFPRWWSFYERGRSFADGEFWIEAETDLRRAVSMRSTDKRLSRTYGVHYIRYFGNRELGIVLFKQGRTEEAIPYLIRSLQQDSTEKAEYYLNLCQRLQAQNTSDTSYPVLLLDPIPQITNSKTLRISGTAIDNVAINSVIVNGRSFSRVLKSEDLAFTQVLSLAPDQSNLITVIAVDHAGNKTTRMRSVTLDPDSPVISLISSDPKKIVLSVSDDHSVNLLYEKIENLNVLEIEGNRYTFKPLEMASQYSVIFSDEAGNRNGITIQKEQLQLGMHYPLTTPNLLGHVAPVLIASTAPDTHALPRPRNEGMHLATMNSPTMLIDLPGPNLNVFQEYIIISGQIFGEFTSFRINGRSKITNGKDVRFSYLEYLNFGDRNEITLELEDKHQGSIRKSHKKYSVNRFPVPRKNHNLRAKAILCPLVKGGGDQDIDDQLFSNITYELKQSGRFQMLVNDTEKLKRISREFQFIRDAWINPEGAAKIGDFFQADYSIACSVRPTRQDTEIFGQIIDAQTRTVLAYCDVYASANTNHDLKDTNQRFAKKIEQRFPLVEVKIGNPDTFASKTLLSRIFPSKGERLIILNMGRDTHIAEGMKFIAYHRGPPLRSSVTNEILVHGNIIIDGILAANKVKTRKTYLRSVDNSAMNLATNILAK